MQEQHLVSFYNVPYKLNSIYKPLVRWPDNECILYNQFPINDLKNLWLPMFVVRQSPTGTKPPKRRNVLTYFEKIFEKKLKIVIAMA